ncbi:MAG: hypothetical protein ABL908_06800, partial [Hyphomicrobium sp.]
MTSAINADGGAARHSTRSHGAGSQVSAIIAAGLLLRVTIATINAFDGPTMGAEYDAATFHEFAVDFAAGAVDEKACAVGWIYATILGYVYSLFGPSLLLGGLLSCGAWLLSAIILLRIAHTVGVEGWQLRLIAAIYAFLPPSLLFTSITIREPFQMLFVNGMALAGLRLFEARSLRSMLSFVFNAVAASTLHLALAATSAAAVVLIVLLRKFRGTSRRTLLLVPSLVLVSLAAVLQDEFGLDRLAKLLSEYRGNAIEGARANYPVTLSFDTGSELLIGIPVALFGYLFEPMPWRVLSILDGYVVVENVSRLLLLVSAIRYTWREGPGEPRRLLLLGTFLV